MLATTDIASDLLAHHRTLAESGWDGRVVPTFRPDAVVNLLTPGWSDNLAALGQASGATSPPTLPSSGALEDRRAFFKRMGATATDHAAETAFTGRLDAAEAEAIFQARTAGRRPPPKMPRRFTGHMLMEMARMSIEDGLVMQLHVGSYPQPQRPGARAFRRGQRGRYPDASEFTRNLRPLLNNFGNDPRLTLDPLHPRRDDLCPRAGPPGRPLPGAAARPALVVPRQSERHAPLLRPGDRRPRGSTTPSASTTTPAPSPRSRPATISGAASAANWLAGLVVRGQIDEADAADMAHEVAYGLAKRAYRL